MSFNLQVVFDPRRMPSSKILASTARQLGFDVVLDPEFDPHWSSGFWPCQYRGTDSGFEYFRTELDAYQAARFFQLPQKSWTCLVAFATRSKGRELAASTVCAAVLCLLTGGVLIDVDCETTVPAGDVLEWARECENQIGGELSRQDESVGVRLDAANGAGRKIWWPLW